MRLADWGVRCVGESYGWGWLGTKINEVGLGGDAAGDEGEEWRSWSE